MFSQAVKWLRTFRGKDEGVTAIEYGLIAGLIAVAVVGALVSNGEELTNSFTSIHSALDAGNSYGNGTEGGSVEPGGNAPDPGGLPGSDVPPPGDTDIDGVNSGDPGGAEDSSG